MNVKTLLKFSSVIALTAIAIILMIAIATALFSLGLQAFNSVFASFHFFGISDLIR